jgi:hypothetical protein
VENACPARKACTILNQQDRERALCSLWRVERIKADSTRYLVVTDGHYCKLHVVVQRAHNFQDTKYALYEEIASGLTNYRTRRAAELSPVATFVGTVPSSRIPTKFLAVILTRNQRKGTISLRT